MDFLKFDNSKKKTNFDFEDPFFFSVDSSTAKKEGAACSSSSKREGGDLDIENLIKIGLEANGYFGLFEGRNDDFEDNGYIESPNFHFDFNLTSPKDPNKLFGKSRLRAPISMESSCNRREHGETGELLLGRKTENENFVNFDVDFKFTKDKKRCPSTLENTPKDPNISNFFHTPEKPKKSNLKENLIEEITCNCKKSKCLKLYCECFRKGKFCLETCNCLNCLNKKNNAELIFYMRNIRISKNPEIFNSKFKTVELEDGGVKEIHKKGCNCKKSKCLKNYCECFRNGSGCSGDCCCEGCENFERKIGKGGKLKNGIFDEKLKNGIFDEKVKNEKNFQKSKNDSFDQKIEKLSFGKNFSIGKREVFNRDFDDDFDDDDCDFVQVKLKRRDFEGFSEGKENYSFMANF